MSTVSIICLGFFAVIFCVIAYHLIHEKLLIRKVRAISQSEIEEFLIEFAKVCEVEPSSYFLRRANSTIIGEDVFIPLPKSMNVSSFGGGELSIKVNHDDIYSSEVQLISANAVPLNQKNVNQFNLIGIPRVVTKTGKYQNRYTAKYWFSKNPKLMEISQRVSSKHAEKVAELILDSDGRVNAPFEWIQTPEYRSCKTCKERRRPVAQFRGYAIGADTEAEFFVLGCDCEGGQASLVVQFS